MTKYITYIILVVCTLPLFSSCSKEDDIESIFFGKTWYVVNLMAHGSTSELDDQEALTNLNKTRYRLFFNSLNSFRLTLADDTELSGTCTISAEGRKISMNVKGSAKDSDVIGKKIVDWINRTTHYTGDINQLQFHQEGRQNYIILGTK